MDDSWTVGVLFAAVVMFVVGSWVARNLVSTTVFEYQRALRFRRGQLAGVLGAGRYRYWRKTTTMIVLDVRPRQVPVAGQEIMSSDGVSLRASLVMSYELADVERAVTSAQSADVALYTDVQLALRGIVGSVPIDDVLEGRGEFGARLMAECAPRAEALGLRLLQIDVRDITFPGDLKRVFTQVVAAQKEGQAALERARGESAALRSLANAAQAVSDNPALLQLRLLQQLGNTTGNTVVLSLGGSPTIVPPTPSPQ